VPFAGGWFVYLGYELAGQIEPVLQMPDADTELPIACATHIPCAIIHDKALQKMYLVTEQPYIHLQASVLEDVQQLMTDKPAFLSPETGQPVEEDAQQYIDGVNRIKQYITEGDVFQVNLSRAWQVELLNDIAAADIFYSLGKSNPAPFAGLAQFHGTSIISSSPERLVRTKNNTVDTRPIAGTRPRGDNKQRDDEFSDELLAHPKERAEHIMLIDLERNDLGRVCEPGTVRANELMVLESYAHVHHIVSNIQGRLRADVLPGDVIRAVFPGGTITGCPKIRCMEIIAELEQTARSAYTGSMGYLNYNGDMDLNILIRTMIKTQNKLTFRAGAGIVADSIAENEVEETRAKARGLLLSLSGRKVL
jgi:anthranilate synthase component 1